MSAIAQAQKRKAETLLEEADAKINKKSWFGGKNERSIEEGAELMLQAANAYKVGGLNHEAGSTYSKAAMLYRDKLSNPNDAAKAFQQAGMSEGTVLVMNATPCC
jgi:alpha-soluble NSF attachment protein